MGLSFYFTVEKFQEDCDSESDKSIEGGGRVKCLLLPSKYLMAVITSMTIFNISKVDLLLSVFRTMKSEVERVCEKAASNFWISNSSYNFYLNVLVLLSS
jgi:hypothetical protein